MGHQEFIVLKESDGPIILCQPVVKRFSHITCFQGNNELLLELDLLIDYAHPLLPCVFPNVMNNFKILVVLLTWYHFVLQASICSCLCFLPLLGLLLQNFIVSSDYFWLEPATGQMGVRDHDGKLDLRFDEDWDLSGLIVLEYLRRRKHIVMFLVWLNLVWLHATHLLLRPHHNNLFELFLAFLLTREEVPHRDVILTGYL